MLDRILDRLEEWLIATLIGAATLLIFIAVVHRYGASNSADLARWAGAHRLRPAATRGAIGSTLSLAAINLSWARSLHLHVRLDGEVRRRLGVRTGIHVGVDVLVKRCRRRRASR